MNRCSGCLQSLLPQLSYGELAVLAEWLYAALPEAEKEPGLMWEISYHVQMARVLDTKNYAVARVVVTRWETTISPGHGPACERRDMAKALQG